MAFDEIARASLVLDVTINDRQITDAATRAANNFNQQFAKVQGQFKSTALSQQVSAVSALSTAFGGLASNLRVTVPSAFQRTTQAIQNFGVQGNRVGQVVSTLSVGFVGVAAAVVSLGSQFASIAGDFQALEQSINAIINNSETAQTTTRQFIGDLRSLAVESGRSSQQLANTGRQFLALGFTGAKTTEILTSFAEAAALTGATNQQLTLALNGVAQIASKGAVSMEELRRQIAENLPGAVNLSRFFEILGENLGITTEEARKLQEQGKITADVGIQALIETVNEATDGVNVFSLRASTFAGQLGIIREIFTQIIQTGFRPFIEALVPVFKDFTDGFKEGVGPFGDIQQSISDLGKTLGESLVVILKEIIPLIPGVVKGFVDLVKVVAPVIVDVIQFGAALTKVLLPVLRVTTTVINFFIKALGESASVGIFVAGLVRTLGGAFSALSRLGGSLGGISRVFGSTGGAIAKFAGPIGIIVAGLNELNVLLGTLRTLLGTDLPKSIEEINDKFQALVDLIPGLRGFVSVVGAGFRGAIDSVQGAFGRLFGGDNRPAKNFVELEKVAGEAAEEIEKKFLDVSALLDDVSSAQKSLTSATKEYQKALRGVLDSQRSVNDALREAEKDAADAAKAVADATEDVATAQEKLNQVLAEGGLEELANAREDLVDSTENLADAEERRVEAAERLADLLAPATEQELANATDSVTRAEIALQRAIRERDEALKALNKTQEQSVDLSGLSLDQLRTTLANARATAAAQRRAGRSTEDQTKLKEDAVLAEISVRDAIQTVEEARKRLTEIEQKGKVETDAIRDARKNLADADKDVAKATRDALKDRLALQEIEAGNSQFSKDLAAARKVVADAEERLAEAQIRVGETAEESARRVSDARDSVRDAEDRVTEALRRQRDAQQEVNEKVATALGDQRTLLGIKLEQFAANEALIRQSPGLLESAIANIVAALPALPSSGGPGAPGAIQRQRLVQGIKDLLNDPRLPFAEAFRRLGLPGFEEGGLITAPTVARLGERFKQELVLPLTKPDRVWSLLSQNLPRFPAARAAASAAINGAGSVAHLSSSGGRLGSHEASRKANRALAQAIVQEMVAAGLGQSSGDTHVTIPVTTPIQDPRLLAREIDRRIARRR